ncbi:MAG TPA: hypothetical protein VJ898_01860 [Natrialbaceae archaeon]|nr:hypothetical protein [Natrialbaceae archaeon]
MSLDIGDALREGYERAIAPSGRQFFVAAFVVQLIQSVVSQSREVSVETPFLDDPVVVEPGPLAVDFGPGTLALLGLAGSILSVYILLVGIRLFVTDSPDRISEVHYRENLLVPWINLFVGLIVFGILFGVGFVFFILPGLFVLTTLLFFGARIAVEDENFVAGMSSSWRLTRGNRIRVFLLLLGVLVVLIGISIVFAIVAAPVSVASPALGSVVELAGTAAGTVYGTATLARAYVQLTRAEDVREEGLDEFDSPAEPEDTFW